MQYDGFDLDDLTIEIRKATTKHYRRAKVWVKPPKARMVITSVERWCSLEFMVYVLNHEFLHWIITLLTKTRPKAYDKFLESCGLYWAEILMEIKL